GSHVRFAVTEFDAFSTRRKFDAVIGRLILVHTPSPAAILRRLLRCLRPGGIVAFHEGLPRLVRSIPEGPQFRRCCQCIIDTFERVGSDLDMGGKLFATFLAAGLPAPQMIAVARVEGGAQSSVYDYLAAVLRSLLPMTEQVGVATAAEVDIDTMAERLRNEAVANNASIMLPPLVGAWTRLPSAGLTGSTTSGRASRSVSHQRMKRPIGATGMNQGPGTAPESERLGVFTAGEDRTSLRRNSNGNAFTTVPLRRAWHQRRDENAIAVARDKAPVCHAVETDGL